MSYKEQLNANTKAKKVAINIKIERFYVQKIRSPRKCDTCYPKKNAGVTVLGNSFYRLK